MAEKKQTYDEVMAERDAYMHELDVMRQDRVNRQAKNSVFLNLFMRKEYQLQLYKSSPKFGVNCLRVTIHSHF